MVAITLPATATTAGAQTRRSLRLFGRARKLALTAHVLASVGWFGVAVGVAFCAISAAATSDPRLSRALYCTIEASIWLSIPIGLAAVATGTLLGLGTTFGVIRHWWVVAKLTIAVAVIVTDAVIVGQGASDAVISGEGAPPLFGPTIAHVVLLGLATGLSVFKPRGRTPWGWRVLATRGDR